MMTHISYEIILTREIIKSGVIDCPPISVNQEVLHLLLSQLHTHEVVEVCAKILYQVELSRSTLEQMWGFSVEAELVENADRQDELCCYVSRVEDKSVAMQNGESVDFRVELRYGDENGLKMGGRKLIL